MNGNRSGHMWEETRKKSEPIGKEMNAINVRKDVSQKYGLKIRWDCY